MLTQGNIIKKRFMSFEIEKTPPCTRLAGLKFELTNRESGAAARTAGAAVLCKAGLAKLVPVHYHYENGVFS